MSSRMTCGLKSAADDRASWPDRAFRFYRINGLDAEAERVQMEARRRGEQHATTSRTWEAQLHRPLVVLGRGLIERLRTVGIKIIRVREAGTESFIYTLDKPDLILPLANERNVRQAIASSQ